ncbi:MAG TPA: hypothetical protein ENI58_11370 [Nitrospirae bacterium]|mgnify:CR=1 FL=1|nr:hypothetical protein [Nitrospirota bacterium]
MARKARIEFEGALYHVITRGNQRQKIFKDKYDLLKYLEILADYKKRYNYYLYAYILLNNHIHLLIETRETPLSKILQGINQRYTMYFNRKYKTAGHLFQGRYKAILCEKDSYLLSLIKYIHHNPVRARIAKTPAEYKWSSHHGYAKKTSKEDIIDTDQVLRIFSEDKTEARKLYRAFMGDAIAVKKDDIYSTIDQRVLGGELFVEKVMQKCDGDLRQTRREKEYALRAIARGIEKLFGVTLKQIQQKGKDRDVSLGRKVLTLVAKEYGYKGKEIAEFTRKDPAIVTRHLKEKKNLEGEIKKVIETLREKR